MTVIEDLEYIEEMDELVKGNFKEESNLEEHISYIDDEISRISQNIKYYEYHLQRLFSDRKKLDSEASLNFGDVEKFNIEYTKELEFYIKNVKEILEKKPKKSLFNDKGDVKGITLPPNLLKVLELKIGIQKKEVNKHIQLFNQIDQIDLEIQKNNHSLARANRELEALFKSRDKLKKKLGKKQEKDKQFITKVIKLNTDFIKKLKTNFFKSN
ncbi:hypothetical protein KY334_08160 [Candidatus Woesearchaeota archaeon]|nr:hypothetical protein [Candidatus Woesearchaeota archaeon]